MYSCSIELLCTQVYNCTGEFNIWDNERHQLDQAERSLHSVTALKVDSRGMDMYTGNSLGYIQV
jgi:hypothetical protein